MRFDLWDKIKGKLPARRPRVAAVVAPKPKAKIEPEFKPSTQPIAPLQATQYDDLDLRVIWRAIVVRKNLIIMPTLLAAVVSLAVVNMITPLYKSEARVLVDGRENVFLRPNGERPEERNALDPEAVTSQVQLLLSRDLARMVIKQNKLAERAEFDPVLSGISPVKMVLGLFGIGRDPFRMTPEERVLDAYYDRLTAFAVDKSRVMVVEFQSRDPELAARVANSIVDNYLILQQGARQQQAKAASQWLSGEIDSLRKKVADAEQRAEAFRSKSSLFVGTNNTTLSNQQLGEFNTQLNNARALKSDAESKARLIRDMLKSGKPIEASEVLNSELIRRLSEQRVTLRAQLAEQSSTLLDGHPRIKELKAQIADLDKQIREEAGKLSRSLENDARIAEARVENLNANLDQLKRQATSTNGQDVELRALDREAKAERDLLESYLAKYREATARESIDAAPADGRIISRGIVSNTPNYPKKLPIVLIATLATLMLTTGYVASRELLRMTSPRALMTVAPMAAPSMMAAMPEAAAPQPAFREASRTGMNELEQLAADLQKAGAAARKLSVLGSGSAEKTSRTALALARLLARRAKVVLIDLSASSQVVKAASVDSTTPGLTDLMLGDVSFGQVISKDRSTSLHLVTAGRASADRALLQSPRLTLALDALLQTYDHVVLDAGAADDLPAALLTTGARAIVVPDGAMSADARQSMSDQLRRVGFGNVTMLSEAVPADPDERGPRIVAA
ncbi:MAG: lipopolysaccharide biosynthesis protein [Rhizobiales bacterium]|nr:lipopolysaccharide biosynthesis protein [Hyphomicrobiales bacterium]